MAIINGITFEGSFKESPVLLAVVHVHDNRQAVEQSGIAFRCGADGVFLINHGITCNQLMEAELMVRDAHENAWVGLNMLDVPIRDAPLLLAHAVDGYWSDISGVDDNMLLASEVKNAFIDNHYHGLYFGGVAFKHQKQPLNASVAARVASDYMDVVTTSGPATGMPPDVTKVEEMARSVHSAGGKIAIASGITPSNVEKYPFIDCFLVSTGISEDFYHFNPSLVRLLSGKINEMREKKK